jgi:hypothetical protein
MNYRLLFLALFFTSISYAFAQHPHGHSGMHKDSSMHPHPKYEKGPHHGKMFTNNDLKVEMVPPSNVKKHEVSYYVFDTLTNPLDAKNYKGSVKYVFGGPNQYIEVPLVPTGKENQYVAALEDWNEYKKAIVTLKANGKIYTVTFYNTVHVPAKPTTGGKRPGSDHAGKMGH